MKSLPLVLRADKVIAGTSPMSPSVHHCSIWMLRPSTQPRCVRPATKEENLDRNSGSVCDHPIRARQCAASALVAARLPQAAIAAARVGS